MAVTAAAPSRESSLLLGSESDFRSREKRSLHKKSELMETDVATGQGW